MIWQAILSVVLAFVIGEMIKWALQAMHHEPIEVFTLGGMPSTHTSSVVALILAVWFETGFSLLLLITAVFGIIVIRDAYGLRWEVTRHSHALNELLKQKTFIRVGHKSLEVVAGIVLGVAVTLAVYLVL
jgi:acid phosphatase family membrane protein YuiD